MGLIAKLRMFFRVMRKKQRPIETLQLLKKRPALLMAVNAYETALIMSDRVEGKLKVLASIKTSSLVGCPF